MSRRSLVHVAKASSRRRLTHCSGFVDLTRTCETMRDEVQRRPARLPYSPSCSDIMPSAGRPATGVKDRYHECDSSEKKRYFTYICASMHNALRCITQSGLAHRPHVPVDHVQTHELSRLGTWHRCAGHRQGTYRACPHFASMP